MKITFLGTGASGDTPGSGRSSRRESSALLQGDIRILLDVTRDFSDLPAICTWDVGRIWLTQIGRSVPPHEQLAEAVARICARAAPAYDGLQISIPPPIEPR